MGDSNPYTSSYVEEWNGTNWTEVSQANTGRYYIGASGASSKGALAFGGLTTTAVNNTESWNGAAWTEVNNLSAARFTGASGNVGSQNLSAFLAGGGTPDVASTEEWQIDDSVLSTVTLS
jgi:hypothetical protein